jgi:hypothetical protein
MGRAGTDNQQCPHHFKKFITAAESPSTSTVTDVKIMILKHSDHNTGFATFQSALRKNWSLLAAFIIPLAVRSIPEVLSWPYPLGLDTLRYVPRIQEGWVFSLGPLGFLRTTSLFYLVAALPNWLFNDTFLVIKILGPVLLSVLSVMMYLYARRALGWSSWKSLFVSILVSTHFVSLRISWDLYKQTLGFIFLVATVIVLKSPSSSRRYYVAGVLMVLTVLSHELAAVTLFFVVGLEAVRYLVKKLRKDFAYLLATAGLSGALFLFQIYSPQKAMITIPVIHIASEPSLNLAMNIIGLLIYCYIMILPLVFLGLKSLRDSILRYWMILCIGIPLSTILYPSASLPYWNRWVYLLVYPLIFYAVEGFERLWRSWSGPKSNFKRYVPKALAVVYLSLLLTLSGSYLAATPEYAFSYYSQCNPYLMHIPSSMLQTTVSVEDAPSLVECLNWLNKTADKDSVIVAHYMLRDWVSIYLHGKPIVSTPVEVLGTSAQTEAMYAENLVEAAKEASANGHAKVYTVWWIKGDGWYQIPSLPSDFREIYAAGRMAAYSYATGV